MGDELGDLVHLGFGAFQLRSRAYFASYTVEISSSQRKSNALTERRSFLGVAGFGNDSEIDIVRGPGGGTGLAEDV